MENQNNHLERLVKVETRLDLLKEDVNTLRENVQDQLDRIDEKLDKISDVLSVQDKTITKYVALVIGAWVVFQFILPVILPLLK